MFRKWWQPLRVAIGDLTWTEPLFQTTVDVSPGWKAEFSMGEFDVLHVDDDPEIREIVVGAVGGDPMFAVHSCASGEEALAATETWSPHLILLDVAMPGLDGPTTLARLQQRPYTMGIPVIYTTTTATARRLADHSCAGVAGFIRKPLQPDRLRAQINAILSRRLRKLEHIHGGLSRRAAMALSIVETASDGLVAKDLDGRILLWNASAERMSNFKAADVIGKNYRGIIPPAQLPGEERIFDRIKRGESIEQFETRRLQQDGSVVDVSLKISPIRDRAGAIIGSVSIAKDISERKAMEAALAVSEGRLALAIEGMSVGVWDSDFKAEREYWSDRYKDMLGLPREFAASSGAFIARLHPEDRARTEAALAAHLDRKVPYDIEYRLRKADGDYLWIRARGQAAWDAAGAPLRMVGSVDDISARKEAEEKLRCLNESLEQQVAARTAELRAVLDAMPTMIAYSDRELRFRLANPAYLRWYGKRSEQLIGAPLRSIMGNTLFSLNERLIDAALSGEPQTFERTLKKADGSIAHIWAQYVPCRNDRGEVVGFFFVGTDVTPIWQAEQRSKEAQARYRLLADNSSDIIFHVDRDLVRQYVSPACREILGYEAQDLTGQRAFSLLHPDEVSHWRAAYTLLLDGGAEQSSLTGRFRHRDGRWIWVEIRIRAFRDPDSEQVIGIVGSARDISERKAIEAQVKQRTAELEAANLELDAFAYAASHDLKAPLRIISNASKWLEEDLQPFLNDITRDNMRLLRSRVLRLDRLLDDLLRFSRIGRESGGTEIISGTELMENVLALQPPPEGFVVNIGPGFAAIQIPRMPLQQVLMNLIGNAIKHHHQKVGRVDVSVEDRGAELAFAVGDDGPGIPARYHDVVFKMFHTLKPRDQVEGSGMGLAIVRKQIELSGGTLALESLEGRGSIFRFTLPKPSTGAPAAQAAAVTEPTAPRARKGGEKKRSRGFTSR
jgi:PAS domain S-box-containing protein